MNTYVTWGKKTSNGYIYVAYEQEPCKEDPFLVKTNGFYDEIHKLTTTENVVVDDKPINV